MEVAGDVAGEAAFDLAARLALGSASARLASTRTCRGLDQVSREEDTSLSALHRTILAAPRRSPRGPFTMRTRTLIASVAGLAAVAATAAPASAIKYGEPDDGEHPYVGLMLAYTWEDRRGRREDRRRTGC